MLGTSQTFSSDPDVADLAETAVFEEVLVETAFGRNEDVTGLERSVVDLVG